MFWNDNLVDLEELLQGATEEQRSELKEIIEAPFESSPDKLCDHFHYLRCGLLGQLFDQGEYKDLLIYAAKRLRVKWEERDPSKLQDPIIEHEITSRSLRDFPNNDFDAFLNYIAKMGIDPSGVNLDGTTKHKAIKDILEFVLKQPRVLEPFFPQDHRLIHGIVYVHMVIRGCEECEN